MLYFFFSRLPSISCSCALSQSVTLEPRYIKTKLYINILGITNDFFRTALLKYMKKNLHITKLRYGEQSLPVPWPFSCIFFPDKLWRHGGLIVYNIMRRRPCRCTKKKSCRRWYSQVKALSWFWKFTERKAMQRLVWDLKYTLGCKILSSVSIVF